VREHDRLDVTGKVVERGEVRLESLAESGQSRIDRGQPALGLDDVPVDEAATETVNAGDDVGRGTVDERILERWRVAR
jgi:hypothetical protein